jgi:DNA repair protein RadC
MNNYDNYQTVTMMRDLADDDKPREKALTQGIRALTPNELIAILLRTGIKGRSVMEVSRQILAMCDGNLARLARMTPGELTRMVPGIGPTKAITLIAAIELGVRCHGAMAQLNEAPQLSSSQAVYDLMCPKLERLNHEEFWVLMLNRRNRVDSMQCVSRGGMSTTVVDCKLLFKQVIDAQCDSIILVHNHPSGSTKPSQQDDTLTKHICSGAKLLDIRVLDHIIITPGSYYSYSDEGRID